MEAMDDVTIARALHVVFVVLWIGGVAFVTTVLLPAVRRLKTPNERMQLFDQIERRFAWQARISTAIVGLTGFYMLYRFDMWDRFRHAAYWWIDAMVTVWLIFTLMLFIVEPFNLHRRLLGRSEPEPQIAFKRVEWLHRILLIISLITVLGAVMGSHGLLLFE
jgi:uncharacterized membrane protein